MNIFVVIREILYNFIGTIIYVFLTTIRFPQDIEQLLFSCYNCIVIGQPQLEDAF